MRNAFNNNAPKNKTPLKKAETGTLRIIGGQWRGRKLQFPVVAGLRPTGDRIRETLFNWLAPEIAGAHCLDLFAGSGALGLEALSRGAASCTFVEQNREAARAIRQQLTTLQCALGNVLETSAPGCLQAIKQDFDIIFLDPPFASGLYQDVVQKIVERKLLKAGGKLYIECGKNDREIFTGFETLRDKTAGQTRYQLLSLSHEPIQHDQQTSGRFPTSPLAD